VKCGLEVTL